MQTSLRTALSLPILAMAFAAFGYNVSPPTGSINLDDYPGGVNSVEISGATFTINRNAEGFISLSRDGVVIRQIPASNVVDLYTFEGFDKLDKGDVHVTFYSGINGGGSKAGQYEVTVPAGFFTLQDGSLSEAMTFNWSISASGLDVNPPAGIVTSIKEFTVTLPTTVSSALRSEGIVGYAYSGASITVQDLTGETSEVSSENLPKYPCNVVLEGNIATLTTEETFTTPGQYILEIPEGAFIYTTESNRKVSSVATTYSYRINLDLHGSCEIVPAPGTYESFEPMEIPVEGGDPKYCTFMLKMPEDDPIKFALRGSAKLYAMNEDGTYNTSRNFGQFSALKLNETTLLLVSTSGNNKPVTPPAGNYALEIPANFYSTAAGNNSKFFYEYTIDAEIPVTLDPDPAKELGEISTVTLVFDQDAELTVGKGYATLSDGVAVYTMAPEYDEATPNQVTYALTSPLKIAGKWTFSTPSTLQVNGSPFGLEQVYELNPEATGVAAVETLSGNVDVYALDGVKVAEGCAFSKTRTLPAGLYIVKAADGTTRKIMVK